MSGLNLQGRVMSMPTPPFRDERIPRAADSDAFRQFMASGWDSCETNAQVTVGAAEAARRHRELLSEQWSGHSIIVASGRPLIRSADQHYEFRAHSDFAWLTGCDEPGAALVMRPTGTGHEPVLFIPPPWGPSDPGFYLDVVRGPLWVGPLPGLASWAEALGIEVRPIDELDSVVERLSRVRFAGDTHMIRGWGAPVSDGLRETLATLRLVKDEWEVQQLRLAVDVTIDGFDEVAREVPQAVRRGGERWLQGTFDRHARTFGNGVGYRTIVGSGPHAPVLHWTAGTGAVREGDVLLADMGVEVPTLYTADVTRTMPVTGEFTEAQRTVYDIVHEAHLAALAACGPGRPFSAFSEAAMRVLAEGLHDLGLLPVSVEQALSPAGQQHRRFIVCGVGHHLGLDVHDCAQADYDDYQGADLAPGMVFTVEPGLYFHPSDTCVPPELRGIGVRIEDDVLVTPGGVEVLSAALPADSRGVEKWMSRRLEAAANHEKTIEK